MYTVLMNSKLMIRDDSHILSESPYCHISCRWCSHYRICSPFMDDFRRLQRAPWRFLTARDLGPTVVIGDTMMVSWGDGSGFSTLQTCGCHGQEQIKTPYNSTTRGLPVNILKPWYLYWGDSSPRIVGDSEWIWTFWMNLNESEQPWICLAILWPISIVVGQTFAGNVDRFEAWMAEAAGAQHLSCSQTNEGSACGFSVGSPLRLLCHPNFVSG